MKYAFLALVVALIGFGLYHANDPVHQTQEVKAASNAYKLDPALVTSVLDVEPKFGMRLDTPQATAQHLRSLLESNNFDLITALLAYNSNRTFVASVVKEFNCKHRNAEAQHGLDNLAVLASKVDCGNFLDAPVGIKHCAAEREIIETRAILQAEVNTCE